MVRGSSDPRPQMLHEPFQDLDAFLSDGEMHELGELKSRPDEGNPAVRDGATHDALNSPCIPCAVHRSRHCHLCVLLQVMEKLQALLAAATERRIEANIDELIDREDDVLV